MTIEYSGGPAFPFTMKNASSDDVLDPFGTGVNPGNTIYYGGMTLRDYFAAHASDGDIKSILLEHTECVEVDLYSHITNTITRQQARYIHADRMLQEREK